MTWDVPIDLYGQLVCTLLEWGDNAMQHQTGNATQCIVAIALGNRAVLILRNTQQVRILLPYIQYRSEISLTFVRSACAKLYHEEGLTLGLSVLVLATAVMPVVGDLRWRPMILLRSSPCLAMSVIQYAERQIAVTKKRIICLTILKATILLNSLSIPKLSYLYPRRIFIRTSIIP